MAGNKNSGRRGSYPEILAEDCTERGLRALQLFLQNPEVSDKDKWNAAQPLVLKRTVASVDVSGIEPVQREIILVHNYTHEQEKNRLEQCVDLAKD